MAARRQFSDGGEPEDTESLDEILELLSQYQRREIIRYLRDDPGNIHSIDQIVEHLLDSERERSGDTAGENHLLSAFIHIHGPKLEDMGMIEFDVRSREVRYYSDERIERTLEQIDELADEFT